MIHNIIEETDSYKLTHGLMYPAGTKGVYSYLEARNGAEDPYTVFFGLQSILHEIAAAPAAPGDLYDTWMLTDLHIGPGIFNARGWSRIIDVHGGKLPLRIKAVPEGTVVPVGNVLMTVENTDPEVPWLTNALESLLLHVWYPTTVATKGRRILEMFAEKLKLAGAPLDGLPFMLHDFGYRGTSSKESAAIGGAAHLVSFTGTDTVPALRFAQRHYGADLQTLGFSVPATEHSIMTSLGRGGEQPLVRDLLRNFTTGIISLVGDSYDIFEFTTALGTVHREDVMARDGKTVVRPDSGDPLTQLPQLLEILWHDFGGTETSKGFRVLDSHVGALWGDGIEDKDEMERIIDAIMAAGFSPQNLVFGQGGGRLQGVTRDDERFAVKCSAQKRNGVWIPIQKDPLDKTKSSKPGRLCLVQDETDQFSTVAENSVYEKYDLLETVFENGEVIKEYTFDEVRARAAL